MFSADREHIHHRLLALGITHRRVVIILYGISVLFGQVGAASVVEALPARFRPTAWTGW